MAGVRANSLHASAQVALEVPLQYAQTGSSLAHAALAGSHQFEWFRHYPQRDVVDPIQGHRFYYHAHRADEVEHGHFHLFVQGAQLGTFTHLAALSLDVHGQPLRWFTTNRWVTGETWMSATQLVQWLQRWSMQTRGRLAPVARWLTAMVDLYAEELTDLLQRRDALIEHLLSEHPSTEREVLFEDRSLDVLSECSAQLPPKIAQLAH